MKKLITLITPFLLTLTPLNAAQYYDSCDGQSYRYCNPDSCPALSDIEFSGKMSFESRYVYRGSKLAKESFIPELNMALPFEIMDLDSSVYVGAWAVFPMRNSENIGAQQVNPYIGMSTHLCNWRAHLDLGYLRYNYTATDQDGKSFRNHNTNNQNEFYFGATTDFILNPSLYVFYNIDLGQWVFEPGISHTFDFLRCYSSCLSLDMDLRVGWLNAKRFNGDQRVTGVVPHKNSYFYGRLKVDLKVSLNEHASFYFGPRFMANNDGSIKPLNPTGPYTANALDDDDHAIWWGAGINFSF